MPQLARDVAQIVGDHYPERLGVLIIIDAPWLFWAFWKLLTPFIAPNTVRKVEFSESNPTEAPLTKFINKVKPNSLHLSIRLIFFFFFVYCLHTYNSGGLGRVLWRSEQVRVQSRTVFPNVVERRRRMVEENISLTRVGC